MAFLGGSTISISMSSSGRYRTLRPGVRASWASSRSSCGLRVGWLSCFREANSWEPLFLAFWKEKNVSTQS